MELAHRRRGITARSEATPDSHTRATTFALSRSDALGSLGVFVALALLLLVANVVFLWLRPDRYHVDVGNYRDRFFLTGANRQEQEADGTTYRWTQAYSALWLTQIDIAPHGRLTLDLGGRPEPGSLRLTLNRQAWVDLAVDTRPRRYTLLLPPDPPGEMMVAMQSAVFTAPGDPRDLGVKIEGFSVSFPRGSLPLPPLATYLAQIGLIAAVQFTGVRLGWGRRWQVLVGAALALALALTLGAFLLLAYVYLLRLAVGAAVLAALTWVLLPVAERRLTWVGDARYIRLLWTVMLGACAIRLVGVFYPTFDGQDLGLNLRRLIRTINGDLVIIAWSGEFADGWTIYPPGPYLAIMPGILTTHDFGSFLQGALAIMDGATILLVALLVHRLGGNRVAACCAMLLYASNIAAFGTMTYGFSAQIFGQWFTAPIALILLAPGALRDRRAWLLATILALIGTLSHIGVAILNFTWFGFLLLLLCLRPQRILWWIGALLVGSGVLAFGLLYVHIAATMLAHMGTIMPEHTADVGLRGATPLLWKGMWLVYTEIGLLLLPLGLLLIARARPGLERLALPLAWLLTALLYFLVDLVMGLQVRYFYFALPFALAAIGVFLGRLAHRGRWGRVTTWALTIALFLQGVALWYSTTMGDGKITMTPLTH